MALLLLFILIAAEISFMIFEAVKRSSDKKTWTLRRLIVSVILICGAMVPAFLFTDYEGRPVTGPYTVTQCNCILVDESRIEAFEDDGSKREVPAYFFAPAEAREGEKFPLVVFSHGAFGYYQSNASTYLELASNGYVVVSIEHPHHAFFTKDTLGKTITVDRDFINDCMNANADMTEEKLYRLSLPS